jgi:predicted amidohydrolase
LKKVIIACAQQQMRLFETSDGFRREISRFLNMARAKGALLAVFPPLVGVMAASPRVQGFSVRLLKQAAERQRPRSSIWSRTRGAVAESTASLLGASFRKSFTQLLSGDPGGMVADYEGTFSELARAYQLAIVAGSAYVPDANGIVRHRTSVFGPDGVLLGRHDKMILSPEDQDLAQPGDAWHVVPTPAGRVGILLGEEALYPEAGRVLAYEGAEILITLAAVGDETLAAHIRHATIARCQDNRCFGLASFLVGRNYIAADEGSAPAFTGKSGIYAPLEMTPRYAGVLVEIGTAEAEGLLTAELDRPKLHWLWTHGSHSVRVSMPMGLFGRYLPALYGSGRTLAEAWPEDEDGLLPPTQPAPLLPAPAEPAVGRAAAAPAAAGSDELAGEPLAPLPPEEAPEQEPLSRGEAASVNDDEGEGAGI